MNTESGASKLTRGGIPADDDRFGLPILRARWQLLPDDLTSPALIAWQKRQDVGRLDFVPGAPWRYETFSVPDSTPHEGWSSWESQQADPLIKSEVERQSTWYNASLDLRTRLEAGFLEGFGRRGDIAGEWISIPRAAWRLLRVPFDHTFKNWRVGHAVGGGLDLWGLRILDRAGLPLQSAAIAYGPDIEAAVVQKFRAHGGRDLNQADDNPVQPPPAPNSLAARMADHAARMASQNPGAQTPRPREANATLHDSLRQRLQAEALMGTGVLPDGSTAPIPPREWLSGDLDFSASSLRTVSTEYLSVRVRPPHPISEPAVNPASGASVEPPRSDNKPIPERLLLAWWRKYVAEHASASVKPNREQQAAAAAAEFPNHRPISSRRMVELRKEAPPAWREPGRGKSKRDTK